MKHKSLLLIATAMLLTACGGGNAPEGTSQAAATTDAPAGTSAPAEITSEIDTLDSIQIEELSKSISYSGKAQVVNIMFHQDTKSGEGKAYKKRIDLFNALYAKTGLKANPIFKARTGGGSDYEKALIAMQLDDDLPDIITIDSPNCAYYAHSELLCDITDYFTKEEKDDFLSLNTYQGRLYGLPIQESSGGFFYNKKIFEAAHIDVSDISVEHPWDFARFKEVCQQLKNANVVPVDMRLDATKDETATFLLYSFINAAGGKFLSDDGLTALGYFNSDACKKGFQYLKDLVTSEYTSYAIGATDFFTGKVGMYLSSGWTIPELDNKYPEQFKDRSYWGLLPYPADVKAASPTGSWSYAVTDNGNEDKAGVIELLKFMASPESTNVITKATGMIPCRTSCNPDFAEGSPEDTLFKQLGQTGIERPVTIGYPRFTTAFSNVIYKMRQGDVSTVVDNAARELQSELDRS